MCIKVIGYTVTFINLVTAAIFMTEFILACHATCHDCIVRISFAEKEESCCKLVINYIGLSLA